MLKAKNTIARNCDQIETAKWLLERKRPKEYGKAALLEDPVDKPVYRIVMFPGDLKKMVPSPEIKAQLEAGLSEVNSLPESPNPLDLAEA